MVKEKDDIQILGDMKVAQQIVRDALGSGADGRITINVIGQIQQNIRNISSPGREEEEQMRLLPQKGKLCRIDTPEVVDVDETARLAFRHALEKMPEGKRFDAGVKLMFEIACEKCRDLESLIKWLGVTEFRARRMIEIFGLDLGRSKE